MFIDWSRASDLEQGMENWPIEKFKSFKHPVEIMKIWMEEAAQSPDDGEPNAIVVSTSLLQRVSSRIVLLKEFTETGLIFYTNYNSRKG